MGTEPISTKLLNGRIELAGQRCVGNSTHSTVGANGPQNIGAVMIRDDSFHLAQPLLFRVVAMLKNDREGQYGNR
jgi:hypothetical protein